MDGKKHTKKIHDDEMIDDVEIEDIDNRTDEKIKLLQEKLKECEAEKSIRLEDLQRTKAEFLNSKKRLEDERLRDRERITISHIEKLLPLYDSFHMAMSNKEQWESVDSTWRKGILSIQNQLQAIFTSYNVSILDAEDVLFDPELHEAIDQESVDTEELHDKVVCVVQAGFKRSINGKDELIRPARVIIGKYEK
ncbi:MAG: nucleotide exchange factor GrpE [Candidatus Paceibacterota bacterium]